MNNLRDFNVRCLLPLLMAAMLCGCVTSRTGHSGAANEMQTASAQPVILVPVFILSAPDDNRPGKDRLPAPQPPPPQQSIDGSPAHPPEPFTHL